MTDKELIKQEIERRIKEGSSKNYISEGALALESLLDFIDSLPEEPASEDLEEEYEKYFKAHEIDIVLNPCTNCKDIAHHFAEWQKQKDQETIELAEDHAMLAGMMKER